MKLVEPANVLILCNCGVLKKYSFKLKQQSQALGEAVEACECGLKFYIHIQEVKP